MREMGQIRLRVCFTIAEGPELANRIAHRLQVPVDAVPWGERLRVAPGTITVSALHPFDAAGRDALERECPDVLHWTRPGWRQSAQDCWHRVADARHAAVVLRRLGVARAFVTAGRDKSGPLMTAPPCRVFLRVRSVLPHPRHPWVTAVPGAGPFPVDEERRLLTRLRIGALVAHDAGGQGAFPKLAAARQLGLPVLLLRRPRERRLTGWEELLGRLEERLPSHH